MKRFALFCLIPALLTGCATRAITLADAVAVPPDQVYAYNQPIDGPSGTIVVIRDTGLVAGRCPLAFYVNGVLAAHVNTGETATLTVPAGDHILGTAIAGQGMCAWEDEGRHRRETAHTVKPDSQSKIRLALTHTGTILITPTAF